MSGHCPRTTNMRARVPRARSHRRDNLPSADFANDQERAPTSRRGAFNKATKMTRSSDLPT